MQHHTSDLIFSVCTKAFRLVCVQRKIKSQVGYLRYAVYIGNFGKLVHLLVQSYIGRLVPNISSCFGSRRLYIINKQFSKPIRL